MHYNDPILNKRTKALIAEEVKKQGEIIEKFMVMKLDIFTLGALNTHFVLSFTNGYTIKIRKSMNTTLNMQYGFDSKKTSDQDNPNSFSS